MKNFGLKLILFGIVCLSIAMVGVCTPLFGYLSHVAAMKIFFIISFILTVIGLFIPDGLIEKKLAERKKKDDKSSDEEKKS